MRRAQQLRPQSSRSGPRRPPEPEPVAGGGVAARARLAARVLFRVVLALVVLLLAPAAGAGPKDADALVAVAEAMSDMLEGRNDGALEKLAAALKACGGKACEPNVRAQLHVGVGIVRGVGMKDLDGARAAFEAALREDPSVTPDRQFVTRPVEKVFAEAKANVKKGISTAPTGPTPEQREALATAEAQLAQKDWSGCMQTLIAVLSEREFAAGKLLLAKCEDAGGLVLEATADAKAAAALAEEEADTAVADAAKELGQKLAADTPSILVVVPKSVYKPELRIDGVLIPPDKADKPIARNPGKATIEVKGKKGSYPFSFKTTETVDRGEKITVNVEQQDKGNSAVIQCIMAATTAADVNVCIETGGKGRGLTFRGGLEVSAYADTADVDVLSPALFLSLENPTAGWNVGGSFLVDVVSAASPDIVATASRRFDEARFGGSLAGDYKIGPARIGARGGLSAEPDYVSRSVGGAVSADLANKMITPTLSYVVGFDAIGRTGTEFDVFSRDLTRHAIDAGVSFVINPTTIGVVAATATFELGDQSKPYRHVPMFAPAVADRVPRGATPQLVAGSRLPPAPLERLPDSRSRFAVLLRAAHRFETSTLRGDERLYVDTWGLKASTTDARFLVDMREDLRVGPHLRFHIQTPTDFWKRAYTAEKTPQGWELPKYRTTDRELGPLFTVTLGGSVRYAVTKAFAVSFEANGMYTQLLDHLFLYDRWGLLTTTTLELGVD